MFTIIFIKTIHQALAPSGKRQAENKFNGENVGKPTATWKQKFVEIFEIMLWYGGGVNRDTPLLECCNLGMMRR